MKAYKVELLIIDFDDIGAEAVATELENANYGNDCIAPQVKSVTGRDIGEWDDNHPLNCEDTSDKEYNRLFGKTSVSEKKL